MMRIEEDGSESRRLHIGPACDILRQCSCPQKMANMLRRDPYHMDLSSQQRQDHIANIAKEVESENNSEQLAYRDNELSNDEFVPANRVVFESRLVLV